MIKVYITNLGKYNEGSLVGEWLELPTTEEQINETFNNIGINEEYEEYFITDYETDIEGITVGKYSNLDMLNTMAENLSNLEEYELKQVIALLEGGYIAQNDILNNDFDLDNYFFLEIEVSFNTVSEALGYALADINEIESKLGDLVNYFDYEKYGRDAIYGGVFVASNNIAIL